MQCFMDHKMHPTIKALVRQVEVRGIWIEIGFAFAMCFTLKKDIGCYTNFSQCVTEAITLELSSTVYDSLYAFSNNRRKDLCYSYP